MTQSKNPEWWFQFTFWIKRNIFRLEYPALTIAENWLGEHISIGPVTIYGANAMHWAVNVSTRWGYFCFRLPFFCFGQWWPLYCYLSPTATPQDATWWGWGKKKHGGIE